MSYFLIIILMSARPSSMVAVPMETIQACEFAAERIKSLESSSKNIGEGEIDVVCVRSRP